MKLKIWELALFTALILSILWGALLEQRQQGLSEQMIRLHVLAHSDDTADQALKRHVRDRVRAEVEPRLAAAANRAEAEAEIEALLPYIRAIAEAAVADRGGSSPVSAELTWGRYPTRVYESFTLPAGLYRSLRVEIGEAVGQNWWCVVFPPLCIEAASGPEALEAVGLTEGEITLITGDTSGHAVRFRTLELIDGLRSWFGQ